MLWNENMNSIVIGSQLNMSLTKIASLNFSFSEDGNEEDGSEHSSFNFYKSFDENSCEQVMIANNLLNEV